MILHQPHNSAGGYAYNTVIYRNIDYDPHFHTNFEVIYLFSGGCGHRRQTSDPHGGGYGHLPFKRNSRI